MEGMGREGHGGGGGGGRGKIFNKLLTLIYYKINLFLNIHLYLPNQI
jgi:hypothetical protein